MFTILSDQIHLILITSHINPPCSIHRTGSLNNPELGRVSRIEKNETKRKSNVTHKIKNTVILFFVIISTVCTVVITVNCQLCSTNRVLSRDLGSALYLNLLRGLHSGPFVQRHTVDE